MHLNFLYVTIRSGKENHKKETLKRAKNLDLYKLVLEKFPDANLVDVKSNQDSEK